MGNEAIRPGTSTVALGGGDSVADATPTTNSPSNEIKPGCSSYTACDNAVTIDLKMVQADYER
jgi:hypothetical protein